MMDVSAGRVVLVLLGALVLAAGLGAAVGGIVRLLLTHVEPWIVARFARRWPGRAERAVGFVALVGEGGAIGGLALGLSGLLTFGIGLGLGGHFSVESLSSFDGPWLIAIVAGTALGDGAGVLAAVVRGERLPLGWPGWRPMGLAPLLAVGLVGLTVGWSLGLTAAGVDIEQQGLAQALLGASGGEWWLVAVYTVLGAPLVEELLFRGWAQGLLTRRFGVRSGILLQAVAFGLLHLDQLWAIPPIILIGLGCGWLRHRSGSLWPGVLLHVLNNSLALVSALSG